jgi:hypothetical protein|uniref:Rap1a immunity protein domain-containing protein n=1 Tax=Desulfobacca acetoxidans TaxID=60893 RepID=A0A7V6A3P3_9BACT
MTLTKTISLLALTFSLVLVLATGVPANSAPVGKAEMINGAHWTKWPLDAKLVYIRGLTNWADFIVEAQSQRGNTGEYCMSKVLVDALRNKTLGDIVGEVDAYYQKNPEKLGNSVIEAILRGATNICEPPAKEMKK